MDVVSAPTIAGVLFEPLPQPRGALTLLAQERDWSEWVSASRTRNYVLRDPLLDWLELHGEHKGFVRDDRLPGFDARTAFGPFIMKKGCEFEVAVVGLLRSR